MDYSTRHLLPATTYEVPHFSTSTGLPPCHPTHRSVAKNPAAGHAIQSPPSSQHGEGKSCFPSTQSAANEPKRLREHNAQLEHTVEANGLQSHPSRSTRTSKLCTKQDARHCRSVFGRAEASKTHTLLSQSNRVSLKPKTATSSEFEALGVPLNRLGMLGSSGDIFLMLECMMLRNNGDKVMILARYVQVPLQLALKTWILFCSKCPRPIWVTLTTA
ncbi:hypothetical protein DFH08DRAFT_826429 [Mycena albidolilacea]|uniref:Uncharacterized protein n=1 Tax=Mycena albidolilacea TaxID=1033008 RepID=A0AAD6Z049_9AGAR|nr:hypothetical protein DFH08DRAFT_826429 [Mycena albidolilacea]